MNRRIPLVARTLVRVVCCHVLAGAHACMEAERQAAAYMLAARACTYANEACMQRRVDLFLSGSDKNEGGDGIHGAPISGQGFSHAAQPALALPLRDRHDHALPLYTALLYGLRSPHFDQSLYTVDRSTGGARATAGSLPLSPCSDDLSDHTRVRLGYLGGTTYNCVCRHATSYPGSSTPRAL
jgi:hypothetical protein